MKKMVSVKELREFCDQNKPQNIGFYSVNQEWWSASDPCIMQFNFSEIIVLENPNMICLKNSTNMMNLSMVQKVEIDTETTVIGTVFKIYCGGGTRKKKAYTLLIN